MRPITIFICISFGRQYGLITKRGFWSQKDGIAVQTLLLLSFMGFEGLWINLSEP